MGLGETPRSVSANVRVAVDMANRPTVGNAIGRQKSAGAKMFDLRCCLCGEGLPWSREGAGLTLEIESDIGFYSDACIGCCLSNPTHVCPCGACQLEIAQYLGEDAPG